MEEKIDNYKVKFVFTGPECCGKTTLSDMVSKKLELPLVDEHARKYLKNIGKNYVLNDLFHIAKEQLNNEIAAFKSANQIICDTDLLTIKIWAKVKYGITNFENEFHYPIKTQSIYFVCSPDNVEWINDELRENEHDRDWLFNIYKEELTTRNDIFYILKGSISERFIDALSKIQNHLGHSKN